MAAAHSLLGMFWDQGEVPYSDCLYSSGFPVRHLGFSLPAPLTLTAVLGRSKGKMISRIKLGTVAGKCVPVCSDTPV